MKTEIIIWILIIAFIYVSIKSFNKYFDKLRDLEIEIQDKKKKKERRVGIILWYVFLSNIFIIQAVIKYIQHKNASSNINYVTENKSSVSDSDEDSFYYFINFINPPPFNNSVKLEVAKCILDKPDSNSCDIKCIKVKISNELHNLGGMPEKDCNRGTKQEKTVKTTYMSETYYVSSSSSCIEHVTTYEAVFAGKKFVNQSCSMVKTDPDFLESSMDQTDYSEMIQVKLRNFDEFERLYEKYYKD